MAQRSSAHAALGRAVRRLRIERGLSQEDLAHLSRMDRTWVGGIERGEKNPSYEKLMDLATALDVRISELIAEADDG
ncbi:MAG: helix-turn-helix transcriptional regulator [Actinobacteria bacterium]|nr:MAG: helix-turn-helix transcriptional regulator [Actinomycetota bacterium]